MKINLQIKHLTFSGIPLSQADQVELSAALQDELSKLLAVSSLDNWKNVDTQEKICARAIQYQPGRTPVRLGKEIAASLAMAFHPGRQTQEE